MKRVLIACEYSGRVRQALRKKGVDAWSCDVLPSDDNSDYHIQKDLKEVFKDEWFAVIAFPPCTHLAVSGARHFHKKQKEQKEALEFVQMIFDYDCEYLCIENPVGIISSKIKKPTQYIQPYEFGHPMSKKTCLWLRGFPKLKSTDNVYEQVEWENYDSGKRMCKWYSHDKKNRDKTFQNIAEAIADQWSVYLKNHLYKLEDLFDKAINHYCLIDQCYYYDQMKLTQLYMQFLNCDYIEAVEFIYHNIICYKNNKNYPRIVEYGGSHVR